MISYKGKRDLAARRFLLETVDFALTNYAKPAPVWLDLCLPFFLFKAPSRLDVNGYKIVAGIKFFNDQSTQTLQ